MGKSTLSLATEIVIEMDVIEASVIDVMVGRFPHVVTEIFKELDDKTLTTCRSASRLCCDYLDNEKLYWVRMIQNYRKNMGISYPHWNQILKNTPVELVKELSVSTRKFYKDDPSRSEYQWSPLQIVAEQGKLELFMYVFKKTKKAKPSINYNGDIYNTHPLHMAAKKRHEEICKVLIDNSEEKNPSDVNGMTAFHFAAERGLKDVCKLIIDNIDNKNPAALNACTPLHLAAKEGHLEIVRLIAETGVDKFCLCNGNTPIDYANNFRSYEFYKLLSKDKAQLYGRVFKDLRIVFAIYLIGFFVLLYLIFISLTFINFFANWELEFWQIMGTLSLGTFVSFVAVFLITIMITLRPLDLCYK